MIVFRILIGLTIVFSLSVIDRAPALAQESGEPNAADKVGISAVVRGQVQLARGDTAVGRQVESGEAIFLDDTITSGKRSGLQILLLDETVFTIGPDSALSIDEFVYDPSTDSGQVVASVTKGVFRFITGKVAKKAPENMTVKLPVGTIGIRGTIVGGVVTPDATEVVLLGPGAVNNAGETVGRIEVSNAQGSVTIARPGYATTLAPNAPPTPPRALPPARVQAITAALSEEGGDGDDAGNGSSDNDTTSGSGGNGAGATNDTAEGEGQATDESGNDSGEGAVSAEDQSGQTAAGAIESSFENQAVVDLSQDSSDTVTDLVQDNGIIDGAISTVEQLNTGSGTAHFSQTSSLSDGGTYDITLDVNFDTRSIGGGNSSVDVNSTTLGTGTFAILSNDFSTGTDGFAVFEGQNNINFTCSTATNCIGAVKMTFKNANGTVAGQLDHEVELTDNPVTQTITGSGSTSDRSEGLAPG